MNDDQFDDLKQFIDSRLSQTELRLQEEIKTLRDEVRDGFAGVSEAVEQINQQLDEHSKHDQETDQRLTNFEHQIAA